MSSKRPLLALRLFVAVLVGVVAAGCGTDETSSVETSTGERAGRSSPFSVTEIPDGYHLVSAGMGTQRPDWGTDEVGTHEPFTLLRRGDAEAGDVVVVSTTGFEGYQGGLAQASRGYQGRSREFTVDGRKAIFAPATADTWPDLVVEAGDDVAIRITAADATQEQLVEVAERVDVSKDHTRAPSVADPPGELEVVGSLDADAVVALSPWVTTYSDQVPGPPTAHAAGWLGDTERETLSVVALPEGAATLPALAGARAFYAYRGIKVDLITLAGQQAALVEHPEVEGWTTRAVWLESEWGDTIVITATQSTPDLSALEAVADWVQLSDRSTWESFVVEAAGGPGVNPDHGRREITRGTASDLEWLLQTGTHDSAFVEAGQDPTPGVDDSVDPCLKLSSGVRACPSTTFGGMNDWIAYTEHGNNGMPPFAVVSTTANAVQARITTTTGTVAVPLTPLPGGHMRAAVMTGNDLGTPFCPGQDETPTVATGTMRVEALDDAGEPVQCLGITQAPGR